MVWTSLAPIALDLERRNGREIIHRLDGDWEGEVRPARKAKLEIGKWKMGGGWRGGN